MKWGVRRYQNEDGSLTKAGEIRYSKERVKQAQKQKQRAYDRYSKDINSGRNADASLKSLKATELELHLAKKELRDMQAKKGLESLDGKKSKRQLALEQKYKEQGVSDEEAALQAYKRVKIEKYVAIAGGVALTAAAAYVAYKHYDTVADRIIRSDSIMKRIASTNTTDVHDVFYVARTTKDAKTYLGYYGKALLDDGHKVFQKTIRATQDIKMASEKNASNVLSGMMRADPTFKADVLQELKKYSSFVSTPKQANTMNKAIASLQNGKYNNAVYRAWNFALVGNDSSAATKFYDRLKSIGYDAIRDTNDSFLSGYDTKSATIVFNKAKTMVDNVRSVPTSEITHQYDIMQIKTAVTSIGIMSVPVIAVAPIARTASEAFNDRRYAKIVSDYRREHPNTTLSYEEILRSELS